MKEKILELIVLETKKVMKILEEYPDVVIGFATQVPTILSRWDIFGHHIV